MKLGVHLPLEFFTPDQALKAAQLVEAAGFDHVVVNDHLRLPKGAYINEAWTVLAGIGAVTNRIRLGPCVTPLPLRHPYLLAKMATTLDQLTEGRLMMGIGAGWHRAEFEWLNTPFLPHSQRLAETEEAIRLIRSYWTKPLTTFHGEFYQMKDVTLEPKAVQHPHPPLFLGGGSLRILELIAKYGQGWMPFAPTTTGLKQRRQQLDEIFSECGRTLEELEIIPSILIQFGKSREDAQKRVPKWGNPPSKDRAIFGTPEDCLAHIQTYADVGATHLALRLVHPAESGWAIQTIADEIVPNL